LTPEAMGKIEDYNKNFFGGEFKLCSEEIGKTKHYGEEVEYEIFRDYKILFFDIGKELIHVKGKSVSYVR